VISYYPVFLNLSGKKVVVIGGGMVAERKVRALLRAGAVITVVSPDLTKGLQKLKQSGSIAHRMRTYRSADVRCAFAVIAATNSEVTNSRIAAEAPSLVNVVDVPRLCNFIAPSVVRRGPLVIAVSTSGASPALARSIRKELEAAFDNEFAALLKFLKTARDRCRKTIADPKARARFSKTIASDEMLRVFRREGLAEVKRRVRDLLKQGR
jgi:precorrin-2 dehydrogenase/sirohydrochlorin ferrochelatase